MRSSGQMEVALVSQELPSTFRGTREKAECFSQLFISVTKTPDKNNVEEEKFS